ncbi:MAG: lyase domain protein repeat-containing protein [Pedosphaera sp.]|nr:lyase domain protein repeat-containing protein [Pedosphaera sp.]
MQSADAVRHIGTNAMPFLLAQLRHPPPKREPEWKQKFRGFLSRQSIMKINLPYPADERAEALAALDALGPVAKDAVSALEALLHQNPPDHRAIMVLGRLGPDAKPALTSALTNEFKMIRMSARVCLDALQSHSEVLFPKTPADGEFFRWTCRFNSSMLQASFKEYRAQHPEEFPPIRMDEKPPLKFPPGFTPKNSTPQ